MGTKNEICTTCNGTGLQAMFTSRAKCSNCNGLKYKLSDEYKEFFTNLHKEEPKLFKAIAEYYLKESQNNK